MTRLLAAFSVLAALAAGADAEVTLPAVFSDHMVLQRDKPVPVRGFAKPHERVQVSIAGATATAVADGAGRFVAALPALPAGGPHDLVVRGSNTVTVSDVLIGEVWLCSGQSNMAMTVAGCRDAEAEKAAADFPRIRMFTVKRATAATPQQDVEGAWAVCSPQTVGGFSAVGYFFGREIHRELDVPVGLVHTSVGGTVAEAWTPEEAIAAEPALTVLDRRWRDRIAKFDPKAAEAEYRKARAKWEKEAAEDRRHGRKPPAEPKPPADPRADITCPGSLWRGMVDPLVPYGLRGFIWYQGESNAGRAKQYRTLFPTLIRAWRTRWDDPGLPFYFVQLANYGKVAPSGGPSAWAELREAQTETLWSVPNTGMAVTIDIGEPADIHPKNKQEVGRRLALWALAGEYGRGRSIARSGPLFSELRVEGPEAVVSFHHAAGLRTSDGAPPAGFAVAGRDFVFVPAQARIDGDTVRVSSPAVPHPTAVRYAWADAPDAANLVNGAGLPASPFRTDDRPGVTDGKE